MKACSGDRLVVGAGGEGHDLAQPRAFADIDRVPADAGAGHDLELRERGQHARRVRLRAGQRGVDPVQLFEQFGLDHLALFQGVTDLKAGRRQGVEERAGQLPQMGRGDEDARHGRLLRESVAD